MMIRYTALALMALMMLSCKEAEKKTVNSTNGEAMETEAKTESTFTDLDGNAIELSDYKGKKVLLNFWATWCKPCIEEMPALLKAQSALKDDYVFLLASDQSMEKIKTFKEKKGFDFTYLKFNGALSDFKVNALPATFIYNADGKWVNRMDGATAWDNPKIINKLRVLK